MSANPDESKKDGAPHQESAVKKTTEYVFKVPPTRAGWQGNPTIESANAAALTDFLGRLHQWLPNGKKQGKDWCVGSLSGEAGDSLKIHIQKGVWKDFASGEGGSDPVSLYAALHHLGMLDAAKAILGTTVAVSAPPLAVVEDDWKPLRIDDGTPMDPMAATAQAVHRYYNKSGEAVGHILRFESNGKKRFVPRVWGYSQADATEFWASKGFPTPRPLYGLMGLVAKPTAQVIIVEGEKCADALQRALPDAVVISWAGGANGIRQTDLLPLQGRILVAWPDNDDPGHNAMASIPGARVLEIPADKPKGWDCADAIAEGWTAERLQEFIGAPPAAVPLVVVAPLENPEDPEVPTGTENWPAPVDALDLLANPPPRPAVIIEGVLNYGEKMLLGGASKVGKTWLALDAAVSVACGVPWLGYQTQKARVLFVNLELADWAIASRVRLICEQKGVTLEPDALVLLNLRGWDVDMTLLAPKLAELAGVRFGLIIPDPVYKTLGDRDENSAGDIAALLRLLEEMIRETGAAVLFTHHFNKGLAAGKQELDRFSGSGVWARDPDVLLSVQPHQEEGCLILEATIRNGKSPDPVGLRYDPFPILRRDESLDPQKAKGARTPKEQPRRVERECVLELFPKSASPENPREGLLSSGQVKNKFKENGWAVSSYSGHLDDLRTYGDLRTIRGKQNNEQLHGIPDLVAAYEFHTPMRGLPPNRAKTAVKSKKPNRKRGK